MDAQNLFVRSIRISEELPRGSYLNHVPAVRQLKQQKELKFTKAVTFLVGENGIGKSTLLEAIALSLGFNAEGGSRNFNFSTEDTHSELYNYITVSKGVQRWKDGYFLRAESFYNVASNIDRLDREASIGGNLIDSYGGTSLHKQSHGESFMALIENRFGGRGIYLLDEPEAALSPQRQLELLYHINRLVKEGSQFIISTHSPMLMAYPDGEVLYLTENNISPIPYEETEHFKLMKQFLNSPERMLRILFED